MPRIPKHRGPFGPDEARRLLWRAGFGPRAGEAEQLAGLGLDRAVDSLVHPKSTRLTGPAPVDEKARPLAPTPGATTTAGGSTAWCAPRHR